MPSLKGWVLWYNCFQKYVVLKEKGFLSMLLKMILLLAVSTTFSFLLYFIPHSLKNYFQKRKSIVIKNVNNIFDGGIGSLPRTNFEKLLLKCNGLSNKVYDIYELYWQNNLHHIIKIIIICYYFSSVLIQKSFNIKFINLVSLSFLDIFSFIVGILGMYGIYIGFLQYVTESNEQGKYLGKNKTSYLLKDFFWYRFSQSNGFIFSLFVMIIIPIVIKLSLPIDEVNLYLVYLWQSSIFLLLIAFIFLLKMSLFLISIMSTIHSGSDYNLRSIIRERIKKGYIQKFWIEFKKELRSAKFSKKERKYKFTKRLSFKMKFLWGHYNMKQRLLHDELEPNFLYKWLRYDTNNLSEVEKQEYIELVFSGIQKDVHDKIDDNDRLVIDNLVDFHRFYRSFVETKWKLFVQANDEFRFATKQPDKLDIVISFESWYILLSYEIKIFNLLLEKSNKKELWNDYYIKKSTIYRGVGIKNQYHWKYSEKTVEKFLWKMILKHPDLDVQKVYGDLIDSIEYLMSRNNFNKITFAKNGKTRVLNLPKYRYNNLEKRDIVRNIKSYERYSNYKFYEKHFENFKWYQFWKQEAQTLKNIDYSKKNLHQSELAFKTYSKILFDSLGHSRAKLNHSQKNRILSMNEEYRLAYMLHQLFYTDHTQWNNNLEFYDTEIRKIMNDDRQYHDYLFNQTKRIILSTNISHRITKEFLDKLWQTRFDKIENFSWFDQFGTRHQMSDLKILYVQELLSSKDYSYAKSRFSFEREFPLRVSSLLLRKIQKSEKKELTATDLKWILQRRKERLSYFCRAYLLLADRLPTVFTKESSSYKQNELQVSVEYLLHSNKINLSKVIENVSITSLLRLEWILKWNYYHYIRESNYTSRTFFDEMSYNSRYHLSGGNGILEFYILKLIDNFYHDLYQDKEFVDGFTYQLESQLNSLNMRVEEYVELISDKVSEVQSISILQKEQIISKLHDILFRQDDKIRTKRKRYRYR